MKKYLITSALPYANGPLHFGHLAGCYLPGDIYTRHLKMLGGKVLHICGSDEHGVAISLNAKKAKKSYQEYVDFWHANHKAVFDKFNIEFDFFGQTSQDYHAEEVLKWFEDLNKVSMIEPHDNQQLFCESCKNHLPDRYVEGTCYKCGHEGARGDECPQCGIWIEPTKLIKPICKICGSESIKEVTVTQWYLKLSKFYKEYRTWLESKESVWRKTVYPFVDALTKKELQDRAITRDLDWGIDVPLPEAKGKKFYVWFDAPIGYVSNTKKYLESIGSSEDYLKDWWKNDETEIHHFLAKDNIIFHAVIFPVMAMASGRINPPTDVPANQYLNLVGKQFSKSTGHYVDMEKAVDHFGVDALRYYLISILPEMSDSSFSWSDFQAKVNGELNNNIGNLVNRCLKFAYKNWPQGLKASAFSGLSDSEIGPKLAEGIKEYQECMKNKEFKKALEKVMHFGHLSNLYFSDQAPWAQYKKDPELAEKTIATTINSILVVAVFLSPFLPGLSQKILGNFDLSLGPQDLLAIYSGDLDILETLTEKGLKLTTSPEALVSRIEDELISKLENELS